MKKLLLIIALINLSGNSFGSEDSVEVRDKFTCDFPGCEKFTCQTSSYLKLHKKKVHNVPILYTCLSKGCPQTFDSIEERNKHNEIHKKDRQQQERKFSCHFCKKSWKGSTSLRTHMIEFHFEQLVHRCEFLGCGLSFSTIRNLGTHQSKVGHKQFVVAPVAAAVPAPVSALAAMPFQLQPEISVAEATSAAYQICPQCKQPKDFISGSTCLDCFVEELDRDENPTATEVALASAAVVVAAAAPSFEHSLQPSFVDSRCSKCGGIGAHLCLSQPVKFQEGVQGLPEDQSEEIIVVSSDEETVSVVSSALPLNESFGEYRCTVFGCKGSFGTRSGLNQHMCWHNKKERAAGYSSSSSF